MDTSDAGHGGARIPVLGQPGSTAAGRLRRALQLALGIAWLADAALQFQPYMFGRAFVLNILLPTAAGNPRPVAAPQTWVAHLILHDVAAWNALFATIQLAVGLGMLWSRTLRAALAVSIMWALGVWWFGEGLGGVLSGGASPVSGAPGAVILYALLAVLVWPTAARGGVSVAAASPLGAPWSAVLWLLLWGGMATLALQPVNRAPGGLRDTVLTQDAGEPRWVDSINHAAAAAAGHRGAVIATVLGVLLAVAGLGVLAPRPLRRVTVILAICLAIAIWVIGEDFGGILTGHGTDPNSGPLLALLALAFWPLRRHPRYTGPDRRQAGNERATWEKRRKVAAS